MKQTKFHYTNYITNRDTTSDTTTLQTVKNMKLVHTAIVQSHLQTRTNNKVIKDTAPKINAQEQPLPSYTRTLAQLRANKCPLLMENLHKILSDTHLTPMWPLCNAHAYNTNYFFTCQYIHTTLNTYIFLGGPGGGCAPPYPLVCGATVGTGATVRRAARPSQTGGRIVVDG